MSFQKVFFSFLFVALMAASSSVAFACACCINPGYYELSVFKPTSTDLSMFDEFKFDLPADIYMSEAGFDGLRGLDELRMDSEAQKPITLELTQDFSRNAWKFRFKSASGREGLLTLPVPASIVRFKVDLHDNAPNTETSLYKELRSKGNVTSGTGVFRKDIGKATTYFLVFQGRGNGCDSSSDYTHWRLELRGPKAAYAFYGRLK